MVGLTAGDGAIACAEVTASVLLFVTLCSALFVMGELVAVPVALFCEGWAAPAGTNLLGRSGSEYSSAKGSSSFFFFAETRNLHEPQFHKQALVRRLFYPAVRFGE